MYVWKLRKKWRKKKKEGKGKDREKEGKKLSLCEMMIVLISLMLSFQKTCLYESIKLYRLTVMFICQSHLKELKSEKSNQGEFICPIIARLSLWCFIYTYFKVIIKNMKKNIKI